MIAVEARGRLGNQMFQFAFGLTAARLLGTEFVMTESELRRWFVLGRRDRFERRVTRSARYRFRTKVLPYEIVKVANNAFDEPEQVLASLTNRTQYSGFFQSEEFFAPAADDVRAAFEPRPAQRAAFDSRYSDLVDAGYVCCHIRRTDYLGWRGGVALPTSYYEDSLMTLGASPDATVVFVGDDLSLVREAFAGRPNTRFEQNEEGVDLQLLANASAVVTSNSSFGWWGSWLGAPGRPVLAPRHWAGFREGREYPPHVIPQRWTQVSVRA